MRTLAATAFLAFGAIGLALAVSAAKADPAVVIHPPDVCGILDGDGNIVAATDNQIVATQSANGNVTLRCQVKGVPNSTGSAVTYDFASTGIRCAFFNPFGLLEVTENWHETVSSGGKDGLGNATIVCHVP